MKTVAGAIGNGDGKAKKKGNKNKKNNKEENNNKNGKEGEEKKASFQTCLFSWYRVYYS